MKTRIFKIIEELCDMEEKTNFPDESSMISRLYFPTEDEGIEFCKDSNIDLKLLQYDASGKYYYIEKKTIPSSVPKSKYSRIPVGTRYEKSTYMNRFNEKQRNLFDMAGAVVFSKGCYYVDFDVLAQYKKRHHIK